MIHNNTNVHFSFDFHINIFPMAITWKVGHGQQMGIFLLLLFFLLGHLTEAKMTFVIFFQCQQFQQFQPIQLIQPIQPNNTKPNQTNQTKPKQTNQTKPNQTN